jgi:hypothetical protein
MTDVHDASCHRKAPYHGLRSIYRYSAGPKCLPSPPPLELPVHPRGALLSLAWLHLKLDRSPLRGSELPPPSVKLLPIAGNPVLHSPPERHSLVLGELLRKLGGNKLLAVRAGVHPLLRRKWGHSVECLSTRGELGADRAHELAPGGRKLLDTWRELHGAAWQPKLLASPRAANHGGHP